MRACIAAVTLLAGATGLGVGQDVEVPKRAAVAELFEDDAEELLKLLTNPGDGPGIGEAEDKVVFSGPKSIKISQYQRFHRRLPGWDYAIRQDPKPGEYRYLRFAWRADGSTCLMLQLHDSTDWHIRYIAGPNPYGWQSKIVADKAPGVWALVTIDLFKDFGERTLTGIAFTIHGGAGYFDHVYLGRTKDDLDRIDASGLAGKEVRLSQPDLEKLWQDLAAEDAAKQYRAFWTLVAGRKHSASFIQEKIGVPKSTGLEDKQIRDWIRKLDSESFTTREKATAELKKHLDVAAPLLEAELAASSSAEVRRRIETLLAGRTGQEQDRLRRDKARQILALVQPKKDG